jgi:hypothetical protein
MTTLDPAIEQAVQLQLGQDPPFMEEDLATLETLPVLRPTDISDLSRFPALRALVLIGYGGTDLRPLAGLSLVTLDIEVSAVSDLAIIAELPKLRILKARCNAITEIDVLVADERDFMKVDLTGNPLSDRAYHQVVPKLRERVPRLQLSEEREWRLTRRLYAAGLPFDYYRDDSGSFRLCRPGIEYTPNPNADHLAIEPDELEAVLDRDLTEIPGMFPVRGSAEER